MSHTPLVFHPNRPCLNANEYIGKGALIKEIYSKISNSENVAILGLKNEGKTSLINAICDISQIKLHLQDQSERFRFVCLNAVELESEDAFFSQLYQQIKQILPNSPDLLHSSDLIKIKKWLVENSYHLVVVIDNFHFVVSNSKYKDRFYSRLTSWLSDKKSVSCVITSLPNMLHTPNSEDTAGLFTKIFDNLTLSSLKLSDAIRLIESRLPAALQKRDDDIHELVRQVGHASILLHIAGDI